MNVIAPTIVSEGHATPQRWWNPSSRSTEGTDVDRPARRAAALHGARPDSTRPGPQPPIPPVETVSGTKARLKNLGFYCGPVDGLRTERLRESIRMYQRERGLRPTGEMDDETARVLCAEHRS